jgi:hypothetical protein
LRIRKPLRFGKVVVFVVLLGSGPAFADSSTSEPAQEHLTPACRAAESYIELANAGKFVQMGNLFAEKVDYIGPDMMARSSRAEVAKLYAGQAEVYHGASPRARVLRLAPINGNECFLEFEFLNLMENPPASVSGVDHFTVDTEGKVIRFRPYFEQPLAGTKHPPQ